jgi:hypothetical protein
LEQFDGGFLRGNRRLGDAIGAPLLDSQYPCKPFSGPMRES